MVSPVMDWSKVIDMDNAEKLKRVVDYRVTV